MQPAASPTWSPTQSPLWLVLAWAALAAGCASYSAAPIDVAAVADSQRGRSIDEAAVRAQLARLAPSYEWRAGEWNALTLLAAALATSPALARSRAAVAAAEAEAAAARVSPGPTLSLTAEYAFNPTEASNWLYGFASEVLLDRGGRKQGRIDTADVATRAAVFDYTAAVWSVRQAIRRALDARAMWQAEAKLAGELAAIRRRQLDAVSRRVAAGAVSRSELERVRADAASDAKTRATALANAARAALDVAAAVGVPPDAIDAGRIGAVAGEQLVEAPPIGEAQIASALELRTEILQATAAYDRAEAALRIAVASQFPEVRITPGYTWERGLKKLPFGLSLTLPSFDRARAAIAAAEKRRAEAGRQLEAAVADVLASIAQADADYRAARATLALVRSEMLPSAAALARQAGREFDAGVINRAEWAASQAGLLRARIAEIDALRGALETETTLEGALRRPLRGPETALGPALTALVQERAR